MKQRFFVCEHCGNMIAMVKDAGVPIMCCGQKMTELIPGSLCSGTLPICRRMARRIRFSSRAAAKRLPKAPSASSAAMVRMRCATSPCPAGR